MKFNYELKKNVIIFILFIFLYFLYDSWLGTEYDANRDILDKKNYSTMVNRLIKECHEITVGMKVEDVDLLVVSRNKRTKVTSDKGGYIKYWILLDASEIIPQRGIFVWLNMIHQI